MRLLGWLSLALCAALSIGEARADSTVSGGADTAGGADNTAGGADNTDIGRDRGDGPARPPLPPEPAWKSTTWERHIEVGGDFAFVERPASAESSGALTRVRYDPAIGYGVHARWSVLRYLRFSAYYLQSRHDVVLPAGSLGQSGTLSMDNAMKTYSFGARLSPTLLWSSRARSWLNAGVGWGRLEIGRMHVVEAEGPFDVRERSASFVEIPLGVGTSFDIIPNWLSIELEVTGGFVLGQEGNLLHEAQAIDAAGKKRAIGSFPELDAAFVQTLGLSLIL